MGECVKAKGSCLCGAVSIHAGSMTTDVGACHCDMCRKWAGGPLLVVDCKDDIEIMGADYVAVFDSSEWAERAFCSRCGTHLFYRLKQSNQHMIPAGFFDVESELHLDHQIFIESKPGYYSFANATKNMTGDEVFAMFAGEQDT